MGISILAANSNGIFANNENSVQKVQDNKQTKGGKSIFAGSYNLQNNNNIELKRKLAQKRAMKLVSKTFASEQKIDNSMDEMRAQQEQLKQETLEDKKSIKEIQAQRENLMESYNVTEDSQEHKDLELLRKETSGAKLSDEEREQLAAIHENGLTNYQKDMLELDGQEEVYKRLASQKESAFKSISGSITDMQIERLKTHPMVDSTKQADEIMEAANKELVGDLYAEAKDHIDEKMEEAQEKAEEKAEKKEEEETKEAERKKDKLELEKQIEQAKQNAAEAADSETHITGQTSMETSDMQEIIDQNSNGTNNTTKIEREIEKLVEELNLIMEDLKGSKVDMSI